MSTSEIAKLESRWRDNPQGLTFAPLAEAYRKQKDPRRALEILLPGLERHPDYIPANIVLGRCHWDLSDLEAAERAFTHVLTLDGENVIALKALADITERQSRPHEAERWLETLLSVDRSNDEARDQLARIRAVQSVSPVLETPAGLDIPAAGLTDLQNTAAAIEMEYLRSEPLRAEPEPPLAVGAAGAAPEEDSGELPDPFPAIADQLSEPEPLVAEPGGSASESRGTHTDRDPAAFPDLTELPESPLTVAEPEPFASPSGVGETFGFERAEEIVLNVSSGSEFHVASAAEELASAVDSKPESVGEVQASEPEEKEAERATLSAQPPPASALFGSYLPDAASASYEPPPFEAPAYEPPRYEAPIAESLPAGEPAAGAPVESGAPPAAPESTGVTEPDLVVTETMAQVFLRQGHLVEALAVYRELAARTPEALHLHDRIAELESRQRAVSSPPRPSLLARDTGGQSLGSFFATLLGARLEPAARAVDAAEQGVELNPDAASATRPAEEPLSLGSVFGEDPPAVAPAVPPPGSPAAEPAADTDGKAVSFDEFFAGSPVAAPSPAPATRPSRPKPDDDLDQFHTWLQSLKR
jgi:tetratricopeptide (TPR) repeat protein